VPDAMPMVSATFPAREVLESKPLSRCKTVAQNINNEKHCIKTQILIPEPLLKETRCKPLAHHQCYHQALRGKVYFLHLLKTQTQKGDFF
jgi:hypothetical protein